jgi:hypothetical protein
VELLTKTTLGERAIAAPGAGLFTAIVEAAEVPPPGAAFTAVNDRLPALATSVAVRVTFTCVALTKVVVRALPFTLITVVGTKPVPATAREGDVAPVVSAAGEKVEIVGTGLFT